MNALPASFTARREDASCQQLCAMEKTTALTEMTKTIAVSWLVTGYRVEGWGYILRTENYSKPATTAFALRIGQSVYCAGGALT